MNDTSIIEEVDTGVSVSDRTLLWGRVGTVTPTAKTAAEAIHEGGLDWEVEKVGLSTDDGKSLDGFVGLRRCEEDADVWAVVTNRYKTIQNTELFDFADNLVDDAGAKFEAAWQWNGGRTVGLTMRFPEGVTIGSDDPFDKYLLMMANHDGKGAVKGMITNVRLACLNQLPYAAKTASHRFSLNHVGNISRKAEQAREVLTIATASENVFIEQMEALARKKVSAKAMDRLLSGLLVDAHFGEKTVKAHTDDILSQLANSPTIADDQRNTRYGLLNATTEFFQHVKTRRNDEAGMKDMITPAGRARRVVEALATA